jgi:tyrosine-protein phosphatase YwqE
MHSHILPGLDDGAADWDQALAMARVAVEDGIAEIVRTRPLKKVSNSLLIKEEIWFVLGTVHQRSAI